MKKGQTAELQTLLNRTGFGPLVVDGIYGPATAAAYERTLRLSDTGGAGNPIPTPEPAKPWWTSRAVIGSVVVVALSVIGVFSDTRQFDAESLTDVVYQIVIAVSGLLAFIGTVRRQAPIDPTLVLPGVRAGRVQSESAVSERVQAHTHQANDDSGNQSPFIDP